MQACARDTGVQHLPRLCCCWLLLQVWEEASAANIIDAFTEALGQGDPTAVADMHLAALQQAQLAAISSAAGTSLLRAPTPLGSGSITPPPLLVGNAGLGVSLQGSLPSGLAGLAGNPLGSMGFPASGSGAAWGAGGSAAAAAAMGMLGEADPAVAAAAMAAAGSTGPMSVSGTTASPVMGGGLPRGVSSGYDSNAESALVGFVRIGEFTFDGAACCVWLNMIKAVAVDGNDWGCSWYDFGGPAGICARLLLCVSAV